MRVQTPRVIARWCDPVARYVASLTKAQRDWRAYHARHGDEINARRRAARALQKKNYYRANSEHLNERRRALRAQRRRHREDAA